MACPVGRRTELEIFGGRHSWKVTGRQLQSGSLRFLGAGPVGRRQGYNCNLEARDFWRQVWKATGLQLHSRFFGWQAQLENDRATTAI